MSDLLQSGHHPDPLHPGPDLLSAFAEQALPAHEYQETLAHLAGCPHCRTIVALALPPHEEAPQPVPAPPRRSGSVRPWFSGWNLAWPGAAAVALASLAVVVLYVHHNQRSHSSLAMQSQVAVRNQEAEPEAAQAERDQLRPAPLRPAPATRYAEGAIRQERKASMPGASQPLITEPSVTGRLGADLPLLGRNTSPLSRTDRPASPVASGGPPPLSRTYPDVALNPPRAATAPAAVPSAPAPQRSSSQTISVEASGQSLDSANAVLNSAMVADASAPSDEKASTLQHAYLSLKPAKPLPSDLPMLSMTAANHRVLAIDAHNALFFSEDDGQHWKPVPAQWSGHAVEVNVMVSRPRAAASSAQMALGLIAAQPSGGAGVAVPIPSISGTVTDVAGAVIPNATVLLSNRESQGVFTLKTNSLGRYQSPSLVPGTYQIEAEAPGFQKRLVTGIPLAANQSLQSDITLDVGAATQTVTVNAAAQLQLEAPADLSPSPSDAQFSNGNKLSSAGIKKGRSIAPRSSAPVFEMLTDTGERWTSADGQLWKQAPGSPK